MKKRSMFQLRRLSWKPVRRGAIFCAPGCGRGCTWQEYQDAQRNARSLALRMGKGWKTRVHENLGWHYNIVSPCGRIKICGAGDHYTAFLGDSRETICSGTWAESGKTPELAMQNVVAVAKRQLNKINATLKGL